MDITKIRFKHKPKMEINFSSILFIGIISIVILSSYIPSYGAIELRDSEGRLVGVVGEPTSSKPFEVGILATFVIITNSIIFGSFLILHFFNNLSNTIRKKLRFVFEFEVSRKVSFLVIMSLLTIYVIFSVGELGQEDPSGDYEAVKRGAEAFSITNFDKPISFQLRYFFLNLSLNIFGNIRIIPFIASIALLIFTYLLCTKLSQKRLAGIISMVVLMQSDLFLKYDTIATYTNFWILFYILALYLMYNKWYLSPISYALSWMTKPLTVAFFPMTFFFIYRLNIPREKKIRNFISYGILSIIFSIFFILGLVSIVEEFNFDGFWLGFTVGPLFLRNDWLVASFLIPLTLGLYLASRRGILQADSVMILLMASILSFPLLSLFMDLTNQPYRTMPLLVFFAIGVGVLFSKPNQDLSPSPKKNIVSKLVFLITLVVIGIFSISFIFPALISSIIYGYH